MSPVPAFGGNLLGLFPQNAKGECMCTPKPDPGLRDNTVIATTTALAYPRDAVSGLSADVCIVRLLISQYIRPDINMDLVVNATDLGLVYSSPYFDIDPGAPSKCPQVGVRRACGPADVNQDDRVNQLDATSITQSLFLGSNVTCGGVYATAFSCGSSRKAPLTPALEISLDSIVWFNDDGLLGNTNPLQNYPAKRQTRDFDLVKVVIDQVEELQARLEEHDNKLGQHDNKFGQHDNKLGQHDNKLGQVDNKLGQVDNKLRRLESNSPSSSGINILSEVLVSVGVVLFAAAAVALRKKMQ